MKLIFGPHTGEVHRLVADLRELSSEQLGTVTRVWKEGSDLDRAQAWAELHHAASEKEWRQILAAASVARMQAMDVAHVLNRRDWAFWAAAWDAAAAIACADRGGSHYDVLTAPLAAVMPSLSLARGDVQIPAQRSEEREDAGHDEAGGPSRRHHTAHGATDKGADSR
jgi:hypothetical protein